MVLKLQDIFVYFIHFSLGEGHEDSRTFSCSSTALVISAIVAPIQISPFVRMGNTLRSIAGELVGALSGPRDLSTSARHLDDYGK